MNESSIKVYNKKQQKILKQMNENSKKWHDTDNRFEKDRLHQANVELAGKLGGTVWYDSYTGTWNGNASNIDMETWACEYCTGDVDDRPFLDSKDLYISGDGWLTSDYQDHDFCKIQFCPKCGRPLTPEARAMLEKRLKGY